MNVKIYKDKKGKWKLAFEDIENNFKVVYLIDEHQANKIHSHAVNIVKGYGLRPVYEGDLSK